MLTSSRRISCCFAAVVLLLVAASSPATIPQADDADDSSTEVKLTAGDWSDVRELIKQHRGKIVVVDIWSTSCLPCMKEFPHLIELQKRHRDKVVCISFNVDYVGIRSRPAEHYRERVEAFLNKSSSTIPNILCTTAADELFEELDLNSIPAVYVFGSDGVQAKRFDSSLLQDGKEEAFTYREDIDPFVDKLIAELK